MSKSAEWELVKKWMHQKTVVPSDMTVKNVAEIMVARNVGSVIVSIGGKESGMLTERDILRKVISKGLDPSKIMAAEVMTSPLRTISEDATIWDAADFMSTHNIRRLPVTDSKGEIVGVLTTRMISNALPIISRMELSTQLKSTLDRMKHND